MKQLTPYYVKKYSKSFDKIFNLATKEDIDNGLKWYKDGNDICKDIAIKYNKSELIAANGISKLSPRNKWDRNIKDAYTTFEAADTNKPISSYSVCTFNKNKVAAYQIAKNGLNLITNKSLKTYSFVNNLCLNPNYVVIDIWMLRAAKLKFIPIDKANIGRLAYKQLEQIILKKANKLGITGYQYQAIIWLSTQRYFNNLNK